MYKTYTEKTVNDAVAKGLSELKVKEDDIKIEVLDSGSSGFLGFGKRQAEVKLTVINPELKVYETIDALIKRDEDKIDVEDTSDLTEEISTEKEEDPVEEIEEPTTEKETEESVTERDREHPIEVAAKETEEYISNIVSGMGIAHMSEVLVKKNVVHINLESTLAAKIIGKRGQNLNALQVLAQNYLNTVYRGYGHVILDINNYRDKRRETLEELALNMAEKARRTNQQVKLEPMPNFERKIMHNALSREPGIETYSEGKEPGRYLVITKK